jgi:hypothetical protein
MEEYQDNSQIQSLILKGELGNCKDINRKLQLEIKMEKYFNGLTKKNSLYFKERNQELIAQIEELKTKKQKMDKNLLERGEEISRLKNHNQNLLVKIRKSKDKKQENKNSEQENQGLKDKLTKKEEQISCLRNLNKKFIEQVKKKKEEKIKNQDIISEVNKSDNEEEILRLRVHNQNLLTQIKKLNSDKKSLQNV